MPVPAATGVRFADAPRLYRVPLTLPVETPAGAEQRDALIVLNRRGIARIVPVGGPAAVAPPDLELPELDDNGAGALAAAAEPWTTMHARHAGNAGDVLKQVALVALLEEMLRDPAPLTYVEAHAGAGLYPLGSAGEWGDGVLRVWNARDGLLGRYAEIVRGFSAVGAARPAAMPGSPLVARALLREGDRMVLHEIDPERRGAAAHASGRRRPRAGRFVRRRGARKGPRDGAYRSSLHAQAGVDRRGARDGEDRRDAGGALVSGEGADPAARADPRSWRRLGVHGVAVELHWTPLRLKRDRLNGAGLILANVPKAAVSTICATLPELGAALQTHGEWSAVQIGF